MTTGWAARLELGFQRDGEQTWLARKRHHGPLYVQRPFVEPTGTCQVYLLHPPGGIVGGDQLHVQVDVGEGAQALITTPGAAKYYRSNGQTSRVDQCLTIAPGASLEWLPQENIVFEGSRAETSCVVELDANARFIGWEVTSLGRPAAGERFRNGHWTQHFELRSADGPWWIERNRLRPFDPALTEPWGLAGYPVAATCVMVPALAAQLDLARDALRALCTASKPETEHVAATLNDSVLVVRYLGGSSFRARSVFTKLWQLLRPEVLSKTAHAPRIWAT